MMNPVLEIREWETGRTTAIKLEGLSMAAAERVAFDLEMALDEYPFSIYVYDQGDFLSDDNLGQIDDIPFFLKEDAEVLEFL